MIQSFVQQYYSTDSIIVKSQKRGVHQNLSDEQKTIVYAYTDNIAATLNISLRKGNTNPNELLFEQYLNDTLDLLPNQQRICYRGASISDIDLALYQNAYENATVWTERAFMSLTPNIQIAKGFWARTGNKVLFEVWVKNGKNIFELSKNSEENEILLGSNKQFEITDFKKEKGYYIITMKQL